MSVRIASLHCYPLKSGRGVDVEQTPLTTAGLANDRSWMIVTAAGRFLTQRELPRLALIRPRLTDTEFVLEAPDCDPLIVSLYDPCDRVPVVVWGDTCPAFDAGQVAATWLQAFLERECRLVRFDPQHRRLSARVWTGEMEAENRFSDGFPVLVIGQASLADLNSRLERPLPMNRFRPNIVMEGLEPYDEDRIDELYDDTVTLRLVKACTRCKVTTTDQETAGLDGKEPLQTLKSYRFDAKLHGVIFGQNAIVVRGAGSTLSRGQELRVRWKVG